MKEKIKEFLARHVTVVPITFAILVLGGFISAGAYYTYVNKQTVIESPKQVVKDNIEEAKTAAEEVASDPAAEEKAEEFTKNPPKVSSGNITSKSVKTSSGTAVVVSTGTATDTAKIQSLANKPATSNFAYVDKTGSYPEIGQMIRSYLDNTLLKGSEISYFYELDLVDCADCTYGGYWTGSYIINDSNITKAFGYITLNIGPYKTSKYRDDYMKLIFSHEYGHHYTMYHRWVDLDIPTGERFPAQYYSVRPLTYGNTAVDYSLGWANCDAEVIAEDYSYFYSGYGYSGIASTHGYPSNPGTKNYLLSLANGATSGGTAPAPEEPAAPTADTTPPTVVISSPANNSIATGSVIITANASDNAGISKVDFYLDGALKYSDSTAPYSMTWDSTEVADGSHTITAFATDTSGNEAQHQIVVTVNNSASSDLVKPDISFIEPLGTEYSWSDGNLRIHAAASDNVAVAKIQLYINDILVAEENDGDIIRIWMGNSTPAGSYILKARAYDAAGNWSEVSITITKT